jgi:hypothetical protein
VASSIEDGRFPLVVWVVLLLNGGLAMVVNLVTFVFVKVILNPKPYTLHPTPYTLHQVPCTLYPVPCIVNPVS